MCRWPVPQTESPGIYGIAVSTETDWRISTEAPENGSVKCRSSASLVAIFAGIFQDWFSKIALSSLPPPMGVLCAFTFPQWKRIVWRHISGECCIDALAGAPVPGTIIGVVAVVFSTNGFPCDLIFEFPSCSYVEEWCCKYACCFSRAFVQTLWLQLLYFAVLSSYSETHTFIWFHFLRCRSLFAQNVICWV